MIEEALLVRSEELESEKKKNDLVVPQFCFLFITLPTIFMFLTSNFMENQINLIFFFSKKLFNLST